MSRRRNNASSMIAAQRARQLAGQPTYGFFGDVFRGIGTVAKHIIPGSLDDAIIDRVSGSFSGKGRREAVARASCPPGFQANPQTGVCEVQGIGGAVQRFLPGGQTGTLPTPATGYGEAVVGAWGKPALMPAQAQGVTLRCPPGAVLGKDNLCYERSSIPNSARKWPKPTKPPISRADWKALQTADRVKNKAKGIATKAGFSCRKK